MASHTQIRDPAPMVSASFGDTQTQILDAAEQLFAEQGFGATSLRSIIRAADVNLAAIHYHFGSKEKLIVATIERMAQPIVQAELKQLAAVQAEHPQPTVEAILHAMLAPALEIVYHGQGDRGLTQARLMGRCRTEPTIEPIGAQAFAKSSQTFLTALQQALPDQSTSELTWKFDLVIAMLIRVLCAADQPNAILQDNSPAETAAAIERLVHFAAAGMKS